MKQFPSRSLEFLGSSSSTHHFLPENLVNHINCIVVWSVMNCYLQMALTVGFVLVIVLFHLPFLLFIQKTDTQQNSIGYEYDRDRVCDPLFLFFFFPNGSLVSLEFRPT